MKPHEKLKRHWLDADVAFQAAPPALGEETAVRLERKYRIRPPDAFRDYLVFSCPLDDDSTVDEDMTNWWSLDRIKSITDEYPHPISSAPIANAAAKYLFFADGLIWSWAWAIDCGDDENRGRVAVISGSDRFVADSFSEFVDRYIEEPGKLS